MGRPKKAYTRMNADQAVKELNQLIKDNPITFSGGVSIAGVENDSLNLMGEKIQTYYSIKGQLPRGLKFYVILQLVKLGYRNSVLMDKCFIGQYEVDKVNTWFTHYCLVFEGLPKLNLWLHSLLKKAKAQLKEEERILDNYRKGKEYKPGVIPYLLNRRYKSKLFRQEMTNDNIDKSNKLASMDDRYNEASRYLIPLLKLKDIGCSNELFRSKKQAEFLLRNYCSWYNRHFKKQIQETSKNIVNGKRRAKYKVNTIVNKSLDIISESGS